MTKESQEDKQKKMAIAGHIGDFYFGLIKISIPGDFKAETIARVKAARANLEKVKITNIEFDGEDIVITTARPGILIGKRGENLDALTKYLHEVTSFKNLQIKEDRIQDYLYMFEDAAMCGFEY
jgi:predicted metal-dependent RNase